MKNVFKKLLLTVMAMVLAFSFEVLAGNADIMFTDPTVKRGQTVDLTIKVKSKNVSLSEADIAIHYDPQMLDFVSGTDSEGGSGNVHIKGKGTGTAGSKTLVYTLKFSTKQAGTTTITLQTYQVTDSSDNDVVIDHKGQSKVTVTSLNKNSTNATLKNLEAGPGTFTPEFDPAQLEYNMDVNSDVDKLTQLDIYTDDSDAKYEVKGNENFKTGVDNKVSIVVTAPNGSSKRTYVIHVNKLEVGAEPVESLSSGDRLWSQKFYVTIQDIDEGEVPPEGYKFTPKDGENRKFNVWIEEDTDTPEYYIFAGVDQEGNAGYYRYDMLNNTIQRYIPDPASRDLVVTRQNEKNAVNKYNEAADQINILTIACICLAALVVLLIIVLIIVLASKGGKNDKKNKPKYDDYDDDDDDYDDYDDDDDEYIKDNSSVKKVIPDRPIETKKFDNKYDNRDEDIEIEDLN